MPIHRLSFAPIEGYPLGSNLETALMRVQDITAVSALAIEACANYPQLQLERCRAGTVEITSDALRRGGVGHFLTVEEDEDRGVYYAVPTKDSRHTPPVIADPAGSLRAYEQYAHPIPGSTAIIPIIGRTAAGHHLHELLFYSPVVDPTS